jgi:hypothetical protein
MNKIHVSALVLLASAASAATPLEKVSAIADSIGAPAPAEAPALPAVPATAPLARSAAPAPASLPISANVYVKGTSWLDCLENPAHIGVGSMAGDIQVRGEASVTAPDGSTGVIRVEGTTWVRGTCQNGTGFVRGDVELSGSGPLMKDGRITGTAHLSGKLVIDQIAASTYLSVGTSVPLTGTVDSH